MLIICPVQVAKKISDKYLKSKEVCRIYTKFWCMVFQQVFQIQLRKDYSLNELKADLAVLYLKAGLKSIGITFLMSDSQVAEEKFLVVVNDMLATGEITELFTDDEVDNIINAIRNEVKYMYCYFSAVRLNFCISIK